MEHDTCVDPTERNTEHGEKYKGKDMIFKLVLYTVVTEVDEIDCPVR